MVCQVFFFSMNKRQRKYIWCKIKKQCTATDLHLFKKCSVSVYVRDKMRHSVQIRIPPLPDKAVYSLSIETHTNILQTMKVHRGQLHGATNSSLCRNTLFGAIFLKRRRQIIKKALQDSTDSYCPLVAIPGRLRAEHLVWNI